MHERELYLGGTFCEGHERREVRSPYTRELVGVAHFADAQLMERALSSGKAAEPAMAALPAHERRRALRAIASGISARAEELALLICDEAGKPLTLARGEVQRAVATFELAAEECGRAERGVELDAAPAGSGRFGVVRRFPRGLVSAVTPFNFPLNLVAHKVAPALGAGCPVILKPAPQTPLSALALAEIASQAGLPQGALQVLPADPDVADVLVSDERPRVLSFTGSARVGWDMLARAGRKRVVLELGGNASVLVHADADLEAAAKRTALGAFGYAGQVCISVQHVLVHERVYAEFKKRLLDATERLVVRGDPRRADVVCGPLIDERAAERVLAWVAEASAAGAVTLCGGGREGNVLEPSVLEHVPDDVKLQREEVFGPVCTLTPYASLDAALARVNASEYGLQAGVFTNELDVLWRCFRELEVGAVIHNDTPAFRVDHMPYGGVKASGVGREGPAYSQDDFSELRMLALAPGGVPS